MFLVRPAKLVDCHTSGAGSGAELFIVEGDAASLSVARARNSETQAVLPMQGKPLNALRAIESRVRAYDLFAALVAALGAGFGASFDLTQRRYDRVLLLMDPDADGIHCAVLMQMFFYRWMRPLLDAGYLEYVRAPVGEIQRTGAASLFAYTEQHYQSLCRESSVRAGAATASAADAVAVRYRGLAAIGTQTLADLCLGPATRKTQPLSARDVELAIAVFGG